MNKLPQITFAFWVMKIAATTLGETAGDMLSMTLDVGYAVSSIILLSIFLATLFAQLSVSRFYPFLFWTVILSTSTAGTTISDYMDRTLELGYTLGSSILVGLLAISLIAWYTTEKSLSVTNIKTKKAEVFYWITILFSNTLGTALGDFLAHDSGLGFFVGAAIVGGVLAALMLAHYFTPISKVFLFWAAFILTRPFGAQFGDVLTKTTEEGGLNLGTMGSSAVLVVILIVTILLTLPKEPKDKGINKDVAPAR